LAVGVRLLHLASVLRKLVRLLFPPDPGSLRLLAALRATLAAVLTFILVVLLGAVTTVPVTDRILGFAIALFITANVRDSTLRQRLVTIALAPFVAFGATSAAALLLQQPLAAAAIVPPMAFVISFGATRGPRYASLGIVALIAYFIGLVSHQPPHTLPIRLVVLLLAAGDAAVIRCLLMPERPEAELGRLRRAIHAAVDRVLRLIAAAVEAGAWTGEARDELHEETYRLGEIVMMAQARVAALGSQFPDQGSRWLHLLAIELATERTARVALQGLGSAEDRAELLATLNALRSGTKSPSQRSTAPLSAALALLTHVLSEAPPATLSPAPLPAPASTLRGLRPAMQCAIAAALAIIGGTLVSPNRWYWAVFSAYVMFQGTRSRSETIAKGVQFMLGTLAGVIIGILTATLLSGHEILTMAAIVVAVFLAFQANQAAFGVMVFWITIILGLLFGMLGYFPPEYLLLRLKETAAGATCGALVASLVLVRRRHAAMNDATIAFLRALGQLVDGASRMLLDSQPPESGLGADLLLTEQRFHELNTIVEAEQSGHLLSRNDALRPRMLLLEACEQWARELGQICLRGIRLSEPELIAPVRQTVARINASLSALIGQLGDRPALLLPSQEPAEDLGQIRRDDLGQYAVRLLLRIDATLLNLATR
jgi:uncharacterized membrane protein YccC